MLEQLVESRDAGTENRRREGFLLTTFLGTASLFTAALIYSLFSSNLTMGSERLEISDLVAPVKITETEPPAPEVRQRPENPPSNEASKNILPVRTANVQRADESPVKAPEAISSSPNLESSRPPGKFLIGTKISDPSFSGGQPGERNTGGGDSLRAVKNSAEKIEEEKEIDAPPVIKKPEPKTEAPKPPIQTGGVMNGKALTLVKPAYPAAAKAVRAYGTVNVQVLIDEEGNVVSAKAVGGPALLQDAAVKAARQSKFSSTYLSKQKVKVTGVIVYNFTAP